MRGFNLASALFKLRRSARGFGQLVSEVTTYLFRFNRRTVVNEVSGDRELINIGAGNNAVVLTPEPIDYSFNVKGDDIASINTQASVYNWTFSEPNGVLSVSYTGSETFLVTADGEGVRTLDNKLITFGG